MRKRKTEKENEKGTKTERKTSTEREGTKKK
jgi:hypothetical protein